MINPQFLKCPKIKTKKMKSKLFFLGICVFIFPILLYAQNEKEVWIDLHLKNEKYFSFVPYSISIIGIDSICNIYMVCDENSTIFKDTADVFRVVFHGDTSIAIIKVYELKKDEKIFIFSKSFRYYPLPLIPTLRFENNASWVLPGTDVDKSRIEHAYLSVGFVNYGIQKFFDVESFTCIIHNRDSIEYIDVSTARIDSVLFNKIVNLESGSPIIFDNIRYLGFNEYTYTAKPLLIYIK